MIDYKVKVYNNRGGDPFQFIKEIYINNWEGE